MRPRKSKIKKSKSHIKKRSRKGHSVEDISKLIPIYCDAMVERIVNIIKNLALWICIKIQLN